MRSTALRIICLVAITLFAAAAAQAQASRTWVSGVGDDANPCSRTAPCKTFAGAISKTAAGGEISVLDPGGYGAVTITKSITINGEGTLAGILNAGTNGIIINAAVTDKVAIRNISIAGLNTGLNGVRILAGGSVSFENCAIYNQAGNGIDLQNSGATQLHVVNTVIRDNTGAASNGIFIKPLAGGSALVHVDGVTLDNTRVGLRAEDNAKVSVSNSHASGNISNGFIAFSNGAAVEINVKDSSSSNSSAGNGVRAAGGVLAVVRLANVLITNNLNGISTANGGQVISFGDNINAGNTNPGAPTSTVGKQ